jgi:hypothetical protein
VTLSMMSSNQVYCQINSKVARNLHTKFGMNGTVPEFFTIFSSSKRHLKQPPWCHRWHHRTKFTFRLIPGWQETSTPSFSQIGQSLNFLRFFQPKFTAQSDRSDVIDDVIKSSLLSDYFQGGKEPPSQVWHQ